MNPVERLLKINKLAVSLKKNGSASSNDTAIDLATQIVDGKKSMEDIKNKTSVEIGGHPPHKKDKIKGKIDDIIKEVDQESQTAPLVDHVETDIPPTEIKETPVEAPEKTLPKEEESSVEEPVTQVEEPQTEGLRAEKSPAIEEEPAIKENTKEAKVDE